MRDLSLTFLLPIISITHQLDHIYSFNLILRYMTPITVYYQEGDITLEALPLKIVEDKAIILLQDRIHMARLINGVWTISSADK